MKAFQSIGIASAVVFAWLALGGAARAEESHDAALTNKILQAAMVGNVTDVKALLKADPKLVGARDKDGWTPLHWAAAEGQKAVVEPLLSGGADINAKDKDGKTPLHWAAWFGQMDAAKLLLARGADVNAKDDNGKTPLRLALDNNQKDMPGLLRRSGGKE